MTDENPTDDLVANTETASEAEPFRDWRLTVGKHQALVLGTGVLGIALVLLLAMVAGSELDSLLLAFVVLTIFWFALWLVIFVSREPSAKDIGVALLTGLVLAAAAFVMNTLLSQAIEDRTREQREIDTRLAINEGRRVFRSEDLSGFDLTGLDMSGTIDEPFDLAHADLHRAVLSEVQLTNSRLEQTDLRNADLSGASLVGAVLTEARLDGADLSGVDLSGADLKGSSGFLEPDDIVLDEATRCPDDPTNETDEPTDYLARYSVSRQGFTCADEDDLVDFGDAGSSVFVTSPTTSARTPIGQIVGSDPDGDSLTYSISSISCASDCPEDFPADGAFTIDSSTGVVRAGVLLDADGMPLPDGTELTLMIVVEDGSVEQSSEAADGTLPVTVLLDDVNDPPEVVLSFLVPETSDVGREIGRIRAPDGAQGATFFIESPADALFEIGRTSGQLTLNHEPRASETHQLTVRIAHRAGTSSVRLLVTITATNLPPALSGPDEVTLPMSSAAKTVVAKITGADPDSDEPPSYALAATSESTGESDSTSATFAIDATGEITLERELSETTTYTLLVEATDAGFPAQSSFHELRVVVIEEP